MKEMVRSVVNFEGRLVLNCRCTQGDVLSRRFHRTWHSTFRAFRRKLYTKSDFPDMHSGLGFVSTKSSMIQAHTKNTRKFINASFRAIDRSEIVPRDGNWIKISDFVDRAHVFSS